MFQSNIRPGQGFRLFTVYREEGGLTPSGRAVESGYQKTETQFYGMLVNASQKEVDQWKQNGHPITHKIIQYGGAVSAKATDCLSLNDGCCDDHSDTFYIQGTKNPAGLHVTTIYYVEQRYDIKKELM